MAPGFDVADYQSASRAELIARYPAFVDLVHQLTV
jgi:hypothetical protein